MLLVYLHLRNANPNERRNEMTTAQLKNAKINAVVELQIKRDRFTKGLDTPGIDKTAIQRVIDTVQKQIDELERELKILN